MGTGKATICWVLVATGALLCCTAYGQKAAPPLYFDHLTINEGLSHNTVFDVLQDRYGYIWVATQNGLNQFDGYTFDVFLATTEQEKKQGFWGKIITVLHEDRSGNLWVGTRNHGLNVRWEGESHFTNLKSDPAFAVLNGFEISSITDDQEGTIWITTVGAGVLRYDPQTRESRQYTQANSGLSDDLAFAVVADQDGKIWVACDGFGVNMLQENGQFVLSHEAIEGEDAMTGYRKTLFADGEYVWLGTEGSGAYRIHTESKAYTQFDLNRGNHSLSSRVVTDIIRGSDGLIYLATDGGGLNRYHEEKDQIEYYTYQVGESLALNSNALYCFWEDRSGNIWIGTFNGGLNVYKKNKTYFEFLTPEMGNAVNLGHRSILAIHQSASGKIWVGTDGGGLHLLQESTGDFSFTSWRHQPADPYSIRGNVVKSIFEDSQGRLWVSVFGFGVDLFDPATEQFRPVDLGAITIWSMTEQKDGTIWAGTLDEGLLAIEPETGKVLTSAELGFAADLGVMSVLVDHEDRLWVGTADQGLSVWDAKEQQFQWFVHDPEDTTSISNNEIRALFQDRLGNIWIGTEGGGVNRWLGEGRFERWTQTEGLLANGVMGITEDKYGYIWATTFTGISRLNPRNKDIRNFNFRTGKQSNQFNQLAVLNSTEGRLFFGGINGLNTILPEQVKEGNTSPAIVFTDLKVLNQSIAEGPLPDRNPILHQPIEVAQDVFLRYSDNSFALEFTTTNFIDPASTTFTYRMEGFDNQWQTTAPGQHAVNYTNLDPGTYTFFVQYGESQAQLTIHIASAYWQTIWFRVLAVSLIGLLLLGGGYLVFKRREEAHQQQLLQLKNENLTTEINAQNSKLMFSSAQMAHKNEILMNIKKELKELQQSSGASLRPILRTIDRELKSEDYWEAFNQYVEHVDQEFTQKLFEKHPNITQNDLRLCTLLRLNLSTKEMAALLNISIRGVEQSRYRLKKRLGLEGTEDLINYISTLK